MHELKYERPSSLAEATRLAQEDGARVLAGGTDLIPQIKEGRRTARCVIDLKHIAETTQLAPTVDGGWRIGAAVSVARLGASREFRAQHKGLIESARLIGSLQIQNRATLAGNLANAAPSADAVPLLIALGATVEIATVTGSRTVPAEAIAVGPGRTSLSAGEIISAIVLPRLAPRSAARYVRFTPRREMDIAVAGSGVALTLAEDGRIAAARIVLASVGPVPLLAQVAERQLIGERPSVALFAAAGARAAEAAKPISDTRGSADYRRELVAVLTRRALAAAAHDLGVTLS